MIYFVCFRNYICQAAIEKAEAGDYSLVRNIMNIIKDPYRDDIVNPVHASDGRGGSGELNIDNHGSGVPHWGRGLKVSCSS